MSKQSFADLGVSRAVVRALEARGIADPFTVQRLVIPDVLAGHDVLAESPTGSGKTLAFGLPLVERLEPAGPRPGALVLVPTRELAAQIVDELSEVCAARGVVAAAVYGGTALERQARAARRAHLLVATPGRLEDLLERGAISLRRVRTLVLDEADRMLDMGFRPPVERILGELPDRRQTLFFSATLDGEVGRLAARYTSGARRHEHAAPPERRGDVSHRFVAVSREGRIDALVRELRHAERGRTLVFVRTKRGADRLIKRLRAQGVAALAMHGDKTQSQREKALARFEGGGVDTLVATDVAARGLDVDDITHVINFDAPADRDGYVHRVGRTGRAGRTGAGITFVLPDQEGDVARIARSLSLSTGLGGAGGGSAVRRGGRSRRSSSRSRG